MSIGLLILRVVLGGLLIGHGTQKLFGWFGGGGLDGSVPMFAKFRYRQPRLAAAAAGMTETGGGLLLALGLLTPLAAAAVIGGMVNASAASARNGLWATKGGFELPFTYAWCAVALAFTGAGATSVDRALGWRLGGAWWGLAAVALGACSGFAVLATRRPEAQEEPQAEQRRAA
ncbi:MAG: DoxX family protein [Actinomycetota bacterium]